MIQDSLVNQDAEDKLVGYAISMPERALELGVDAGDFHSHKHRALWEIVGSIARAGRTPNVVTITERLTTLGKLTEYGGPAELARLVNSFAWGHEAEEAAKIVKDLGRRRALVQLASDIAKAAYNRGEEPATTNYIERMSNLAHVEHGAEHWSRWLSELYDEIEKRAKNPDDVWGIQTGFARFDRVTGGLQPGESFILSGPPGMGKSMLAMQMAGQMAAHAPGVIYSIEMSGVAVARRITSAASGVMVSSIKRGKLEGGDWDNIVKAIDALAGLPVYMSDASNWTSSALQADMARLKAQAGIGWFVLDYMLLISDGAGLARHERTEMISRAIKLICRNLDLAGLTVHSMNKAGLETTTPDMSHLSGSGQVSYDADLIAFLQPFTSISTMDSFISPADQANMRTLVFAKGRELEDPARYLHLVKQRTFPLFGDYQPEG